ncbi:MAG: TGS domain-containing protein [Candidatus Heimdallarchaeota archaeon]|nr:TGS domain-containing protein [Candidatus Heimdallarchaeota archaeon]
MAPSIRWYSYQVAKRMFNKEGKELVEEIDDIIEEITRKKWDKYGPYKLLMAWLEGIKKETLKQPKKKTKQYDPFYVPEAGAGRIVLFGLSNVGKSTLMNAITNTEVKTGAFLNTTRIAQAGSCTYRNVCFQIVDLPGFLDFKEEWAINKQIVRVTRTSDAIMMVIDLSMDIKRQLTFLTEQLTEAELLVDGEACQNIGIIATKGDLPGTEEAYEQLVKMSQWPVHPISIEHPETLEKIKEILFNLLAIIRVYTKPQGEKADLTEPFILPVESTVADVARKIHSSFLKTCRYARVWGTSVEFPGQQVGLDHQLADEDIVELIISRKAVRKKHKVRFLQKQ